MVRAKANPLAMGGLPKSPLKLKDIPFENGDGQKLRVCRDCAGSGKAGTARHEELNDETKQMVTTETRKINGNDAKKIRGVGWHVDLARCDACKGAGTIVVKESADA